MYRVITQFQPTGAPRPTIDHGPWHAERATAEAWAAWLQQFGYLVKIESQTPAATPSTPDAALARALANMA